LRGKLQVMLVNEPTVKQSLHEKKKHEKRGFGDP